MKASDFADDCEIVLAIPQGGEREKNKFYEEFNMGWYMLLPDDSVRPRQILGTFGASEMPFVGRINGRTGMPIKADIQVGDTVRARHTLAKDDPLRTMANDRPHLRPPPMSDDLWLNAEIVEDNGDGTFLVEWAYMIDNGKYIGGTTAAKGKNDMHLCKNFWHEMRDANTGRELLHKWSSEHYDDDDAEEDNPEKSIAPRVALYVDKWCPDWWLGKNCAKPQVVETPDQLVSFERISRHAAVVWLSSMCISLVSVSFTQCHSGGPTWAYVLALLPGMWAAWDEVAILKDMTAIRYQKTVQANWFDAHYDLRAHIAERQFFTPISVLPVKGIAGSVIVLLLFSFLDQYDLMAKIFFIAASNSCDADFDYSLSTKFGDSFFSVPLIGDFSVSFVHYVGVSGIALMLFIIFVVICQGLAGGWMLYRMSQKSFTYKRSIADLAKASSFASMRAVERFLNDVAIQQELSLMDRVEAECKELERVQKDETDSSWLIVPIGCSAPGTESPTVLLEMRETARGVMLDFFRNLIFVFAIRVLGENLLNADLQASYVGLMWSHLAETGVAKACLSICLSTSCSAYKLFTIFQQIPRQSTQFRHVRRSALVMVVILCLLVFHIFAKLFAAFRCKHHLLNLSQLGCYQPADSNANVW